MAIGGAEQTTNIASALGVGWTKRDGIGMSLESSTHHDRQRAVAGQVSSAPPGAEDHHALGERPPAPHVEIVQPVPIRGLLQTDDVLPWLLTWYRAGLRCALVTVVGVEGGAPRTVGAQMAISEKGEYVGYLSGGCLERSVAFEALASLREGKNRLVRYGKDSPYLDIRLPCGAALDVYFDQSLDVHAIMQLKVARARRVLVALRTDLASGTSEIIEPVAPEGEAPRSVREDDVFTRVYVPPLKLQMIGAGPAVAAIAKLAGSIGMEVEAATPDESTRLELGFAGIDTQGMASAALPGTVRVDRWTAAVVAFHDHDWEPQILKALLDTPSFYIGVLGSRSTHATRLAVLAAEGVDDATLARIRGPIGLVPGAKSRASLAVGVLAEIMAEAKANNFVM